MSGVGSSTISGTPSCFLILPAAGGDRAGSRRRRPPSRRRRHDGGEAFHRLLHLGRGLDAARPRRQRGRPVDGGDQRDGGTASGGLGGDRVALLAGAAVGDHAHGVDRFAGAAGADDDLAARPDPAAPNSRSTAATIASGDASRPAPESPPASRPDFGFDDVDAARRAAWRCCRRPPGAPTSRCASPGRSSPAPGWRAARW